MIRLKLNRFGSAKHLKHLKQVKQRLLSGFIIKHKIGLAKQDSILVQTLSSYGSKRRHNIKYTHADLTGGFVLRGCWCGICSLQGVGLGRIISARACTPLWFGSAVYRSKEPPLLCF